MFCYCSSDGVWTGSLRMQNMGYRTMQYKYCIHDGKNEYHYEYEWLGETYYSKQVINRYLPFSGNVYYITQKICFLLLESLIENLWKPYIIYFR